MFSAFSPRITASVALVGLVSLAQGCRPGTDIDDLEEDDSEVAGLDEHPVQEARLHSTSGDGFGESISVSGDTVIVAATNAGGGWTTPGFARGRVDIYRRKENAWIKEAALLRFPKDYDHQFASCVDISGDTAVVGTTPGTNAPGVVHVFTRQNGAWSLQANLVTNDHAIDNFGMEVSISGDTIVVGATWAGKYAGAAYVFTRDGSSWSQQARLVADDAASYRYFGGSVAISDDSLVVGSISPLGSGGAAYVFTRTGETWSQQAKLTPPDAAKSYFGNSVDISGDTAIVGAPRDGTASVGAAYVFQRAESGWSQAAKLVAGDGVTSQGFGSSLALDGDRVLVGSPQDAKAEGATYLFTRDGGAWTQQARLREAIPKKQHWFGSGVAVSNDLLVAGAPATEGYGESAVIVYRLE